MHALSQDNCVVSVGKYEKNFYRTVLVWLTNRRSSFKTYIVFVFSYANTSIQFSSSLTLKRHVLTSGQICKWNPVNFTGPVRAKIEARGGQEIANAI